MNSQRFDDVLAKCLEGSATAVEQAELVAAAEDSDELASRLRQAAIMDASLRSLGRDRDAFLRSVQARLTRKGASAKFSSHMRGRIERTTRSSRQRPLWPALLAMAAVVALGVGLALFGIPQKADPEQAVATVLEFDPAATISVAGSPSVLALAVGMRVSGPSSLRSADGHVVLGYPDGSRIEARRSTTVDILSASRGKQVRLSSGSMCADVAKQPDGFPLVVQVPYAEASVIGTRFGLATSTRGTLLQVLEGTVSYRRLSDGATVSVAAGQNVLASAEGDFGVRPNRIDSGMKALYLFNEMSGDRVHDVSGIGEPMDLAVRDPADAWTPDGLNDKSGRTGISFTGNAAKFIQGIKRNHGLTIEFWATVRGTTSAPTVCVVKMSNASFTSTTWLNPCSRDQGPRHVAMVFNEVDGRFLLTSYDGSPDIQVKDLGPVSTTYGTLTRLDDVTIEMSPDAAPAGATLTTEFHMLAFFGRALTASEVDQNRAAGIPVAAPFEGLDASR
ncbi:MAG: FecR domain-containing protein [Planctomycetes bacterium]|nr:FecR domain-containing protein [Planctomycetota bacterium]